MKNPTTTSRPHTRTIAKIVLAATLALSLPMLMPTPNAQAGVYTRVVTRVVRVPRRVCRVRTVRRYRIVYRYGRRYLQRRVIRLRSCRTVYRTAVRRYIVRRYY